MILLDVTVLVALFYVEHPHHQRARRWWAEQGASGRVAVPDLVWVGFVRLVTNPRLFPAPRTSAEAATFVAALLEGAPPVPTGPEVLGALTQVAKPLDVRGHLVTDAYIAAVAVSLGASVVTFDRDFRKFDGVRIIEPA